LPVSFEELGHQLVLGFLARGVQRDTVDRAHLLALRLVEMTDALGAFVGVDLIDLFALVDGAVGALRFADVAVDAFVGNHQSHGFRFLAFTLI